MKNFPLTFHNIYGKLYNLVNERKLVYNQVIPVRA